MIPEATPEINFGKNIRGRVQFYWHFAEASGVLTEISQSPGQKPDGGQDMKVILGAAPNTGNQGVSALCFSAVDGLAARGIGPIAVADHGRGARPETWVFDGEKRDVTLFGLSHTRRYWRGDCLTTMKALVPLGGLGSQSARIIAGADVVMDVSGGDSFTDLYGPKRFGAMTLQKLMALDNGKPLILLPQTLGPFREEANRALAADILRRSAAVFVRDAVAFGVLKDMLGDGFDPARHRKGPDMAVLLPQSEPAELPEIVTRWLSERDDHPVAGLNVSGLLCQDPEAAQKTYGLADLHTNQIDAAAMALLNSDPALRRPGMLSSLRMKARRPRKRLGRGQCAAKTAGAGLCRPCDRSATDPQRDRAEMGHRAA